LGGGPVRGRVAPWGAYLGSRTPPLRVPRTREANSALDWNLLLTVPTVLERERQVNPRL